MQNARVSPAHRRIKGMKVFLHGALTPKVRSGMEKILSAVGGQVVQKIDEANVLILDDTAEHSIELRESHTNEPPRVLDARLFSPEHLLPTEEILNDFREGVDHEVWQKLPMVYSQVCGQFIDLSKANLSDLNLSAMNWTWIDISAASMQRVNGSKCQFSKIDGIDLDHSNLTEATVFYAKDCFFRNCNIDRATIYGVVRDTYCARPAGVHNGNESQLSVDCQASHQSNKFARK